MAPRSNPRHPSGVSTEHSHPTSNALLAGASPDVEIFWDLSNCEPSWGKDQAFIYTVIKVM